MLYLSSNSDIMILRRDIFQAIADPTRRAILVLLASQTMTAGAIAEKFPGARSTVSKHIQILQQCELIDGVQKGREIHYQFRMEKMEEIDTWMAELKNSWDERFDRLDDYLEKLQTKK